MWLSGIDHPMRQCPSWQKRPYATRRCTRRDDRQIQLTENCEHKSVGSELAFSLLQLLVSPLTPTVISIASLLDLAQFVTPWRQRQHFGVNSLDIFNIGVKSPDTSDVSVSQSPHHNQMITSLQLLAPYALQQLSAPTLIWRCFTLIDHCVGNSPQFSYWSIISVYNRMIDCP